jgi:cation diffusion facilitator CzcD-associated flavoprotein CzcO
VVTDTIDSFDETGIRLTSGGHVDADVIVTATGLNLVTVGEMEFTVDGEAVDFSKRWTYRGMGYSDVPNLITTFGYINASWTLRADLISSYVCRLLNHMRAADAVQATPRLRAADRGMRQRPFIEDFSPGYMQRVMHLMPMQGDREVTDGVMQFLSDADVQRLLVSQR